MRSGQASFMSPFVFCPPSRWTKSGQRFDEFEFLWLGRLSGSVHPAFWNRGDSHSLLLLLAIKNSRSSIQERDSVCISSVFF